MDLGHISSHWCAYLVHSPMKHVPEIGNVLLLADKVAGTPRAKSSYKSWHQSEGWQTLDFSLHHDAATRPGL